MLNVIIINFDFIDIYILEISLEVRLMIELMKRYKSKLYIFVKKEIIIIIIRIYMFLCIFI